jgi:hypothetical protein
MEKEEKNNGTNILSINFVTINAYIAICSILSGNKL